MEKIFSPKISTAYHEAGHAVASWNLGKRFRSITIVPKGESLGSVKSNFYLKRDPGVFMDSRMINWMEKEALILYAGYYAEKKYSGRGNSVGARSDFEKANALLFRIVEGKLGYYYGRYIRAQAEYLWICDDGSDNHLWPIVVGLANELMKVHTMKGKTAWKFINDFILNKKGQPVGQLPHKA